MTTRSKILSVRSCLVPSLICPIHLAISWSKSVDCVKALVASSANINARTSEGATTLQLSLEAGDAMDEIVRFLLSNGADLNSEVGLGRSMVHLAAAMGLAKIVLLLLAYGGDSNLSRVFFFQDFSNGNPKKSSFHSTPSTQVLILSKSFFDATSPEAASLLALSLVLNAR